jgi:IS30 family transposase
MTIASAKAFRSVPKEMRKTLTVDNGKEFAYFKQLEKKQVSLFISPTLIRLGSAVQMKIPTA